MVIDRAPVQVGDTIGIEYQAYRGVRFFFACRVTSVFDGPVEDSWRTGFTYRTLRGHPELGEETFVSEKDMLSGAVTVALRSWSRPGHWFTRLFPARARKSQVYASEGALRNLERITLTAHPELVEGPAKP